MSGHIDSPVMTLKEVASFLRVSPKTVYRMVWAGSIPFMRVGKAKGEIRIKMEDINQMFKKEVSNV